MESRSLEYHKGELAVANDPTHPGHCLPELPKDYKSILDVGCGIGQSLSALGVPFSQGFGVDIDAEAVSRSPGYDLRHGSGEKIPFADGQFDFVMCRVALPYMHVTKALREMHRVLMPQGHIWLLLHGKSSFWRRLVSATQKTDIKDIVFLGYVLVNSLLAHFGLQVALCGRYESFQTNASINRNLRATGFSDIKITRDRFFIVTAERQ